MKIEDTFHGYLEIDGEAFAYSITNQIITLLPAQSDVKKRYEVTERIATRTVDLPEFIHGEDNSAQIAFMRTSNFYRSTFGFVPALSFSPPIIFKANGNADGYYNKLTEDWDRFHAITFVGGNINALFDPQMAIVQQQKDDLLPQNGVTVIKTRPWEDYTRTTDFTIDNHRVNLTLSVFHRGENHDKTRKGAVVLGELNTLIRFTFENSQSFTCVEKCYKIVRSLVALLTMQNNVGFETYLNQRDSAGKLFQSAICKIYDGYEDYATKNQYSVLPLSVLFDYLPALIERIENKKYDSLLSLLPEDNRHTNLISITNVQDICTALEVAYGWGKRKRNKDILIADLKKRIKATITTFVNEQSDMDVNNETTISSAFQYLDYTLKDKIEALYQENKEIVDLVSKKWSLPTLSIERIAAFVKLRNSKTHSGEVEWGERAEIYTLLFALEYICVLKDIGVPNETIKNLIYQVF